MKERGFQGVADHKRSGSYSGHKRNFRYNRNRNKYKYIASTNKNSYPESPHLPGNLSYNISPNPIDLKTQFDISTSIKQLNADLEVIQKTTNILDEADVKSKFNLFTRMTSRNGKSTHSPLLMPIKNIKLVKLLNLKREIIKREGYQEGIIVNSVGMGIKEEKPDLEKKERKDVKTMASSCIRILNRPNTHSSNKNGDKEHRGHKIRNNQESEDEHKSRHQLGHLFRNHYISANNAYSPDVDQIRLNSRRLLSTVYDTFENYDKSRTQKTNNFSMRETERQRNTECINSSDINPYSHNINNNLNLRGTQGEREFSTPFRFALNHLPSESTPTNNTDQRYNDFCGLYTKSQTDRIIKNDSFHLFHNKEIAEHLKSNTQKENQIEELKDHDEEEIFKILGKEYKLNNPKTNRQFINIKKGSMRGNNQGMLNGFIGRSMNEINSSSTHLKHLFSSFDGAKKPLDLENGVFSGSKEGHLFVDPNDNNRVKYYEILNSKQPTNILPSPIIYSKSSIQSKLEEKSYEENNKKLLILKVKLEKNSSKQKVFAFRFLQEYLNWSDIAKLTKADIDRFILDVKEIKEISYEQSTKEFIMKSLDWKQNEIKDKYESQEKKNIKNSQKIKELIGIKEENSTAFGKYNNWFRNNKLKEKYSKFVRHIKTGNLNEAEKAIKDNKTQNNKSNILEKILLERAVLKKEKNKKISVKIFN